MKIKRVLLILCFLTIFSFASASAQVSDVDFSIPSYQIDAFIQEDGSVDIVERITYDGSFNGQYREIVYGGGGV
ncbi:MAG TPA: hypothetical protein DHN33_03275, partial [Eubacteriaceae bacterium]|nr:hypothetical protein [Eubacteriaceae bacterium]